MKHFDPKSANSLAALSGGLFRVFAPWHSGAFAAGLSSARPSVSGRFLCKNLIGLEPQSKQVFACLNCGGVMARATPGAREAHLTNRIAARRPQGRLRQKAPQPPRTARHRARPEAGRPA